MTKKHEWIPISEVYAKKGKEGVKEALKHLKMVGYSLSSHFNDTYMFEMKKFSSIIPHCPKCGYRLDFTLTNPEYKLGKPNKDSADCLYPAARKAYKYDLSSTYDGLTIATSAFKMFCEKNGYGKDMIFKGFKEDVGHFHLLVKKKIKFDTLKKETRFEKLCPECGNYESVVGAYPAFLLVTKPLSDGFYCSDLLFASGNEKSPLILVGIKTYQRLKASKLKGLEFEPAYGLD